MKRLLFLPSACLREWFWETVDHVGILKGLRYGDQKAGRALYALNCASCHGAKGELALNPLARRFAKDAFKFGNDPYAIWKTISYGNGLMFRWDAALTAKERYQIVHFMREEILKDNNPKQYFPVTEEYLSKISEIAVADSKADASNAQKIETAPGMIDGTGGKNMVYGPFLQHGMAYTPVKNQNAEFMPDVTEKAIAVDLAKRNLLRHSPAQRDGLWRSRPRPRKESPHQLQSRPLRPGGEPSPKRRRNRLGNRRSQGSRDP